VAGTPQAVVEDVFPVLHHLTIYDITRAHLLDIIGKVEKRGSLSVAEKLRTWFTQLFTYATVAIPNMHDNALQQGRVERILWQRIALW